MGKGKKKKAKAREKYLHVPQHIMEISELGTAEKLLLAHIYSFGAKGCWQSNQTIGKLFDVNPRTIKRRLTRIKKFLYARSPHSRLRTFLAKSHPDVKRMAINERPVRHVQEGQNCPPSRGTELCGIRDKSGPTTGTERAPQQGQNCPPTITYTSTETNKSTPAPTPPAPWQGVASAPGPDEETRKHFEQIKAEIEARRWKPLPQEEFERRRASLKKQLREAERLERRIVQPESPSESLPSGEVKCPTTLREPAQSATPCEPGEARISA
jgi:hypothetical protein